MASRTAPLPEDNDEELTAGVQYSETSIPQVEGEVSEATHQDRVRKLLAQLLVGLLAVVVVLGFATMALSNLLHIKADDLKSLVQLFFTSILTLVSTVIGFYFGSEHKSKHDDKSQ